MRSQILGIATIVLLVSTIAHAVEFPYRAVIKKPKTQIRSGPGKNYYATDEFDEGFEVEVYRHDPGGWCAIRPPEGSFSWVRARNLDVDETNENIAMVNAYDVVARTGSSLSRIRDVIQVHLEKGEAVELVDGDEIMPGSWRKIAPPTGEFRWIAQSAIEALPQPVVPAVAQKSDDQKSGDGVVQSAFDDDGAPILESDGVAPDAPNPGRTRRRRLSHAALQQEIVDIDLEISLRVSQAGDDADFGDLWERAEYALDAAPTALDRAAVRDLMTKIDRFEKLSVRSADVQLAQSRRKSAAEAAQTTNAIVADTSRFDGTGRLARVISKQPNAPQYALVDANGTVQYYISPSPGLNLQQFLNKEVGVSGTRGTVASRQRQTLNAQRITELPTRGGAARRF
jgi:SH3-like domain-containing protein